MKTKYRFAGRFGDRLVWESTTRMHNDSRVSQLAANAEWFYGTMRRQSDAASDRRNSARGIGSGTT